MLKFKNKLTVIRLNHKYIPFTSIFNKEFPSKSPHAAVSTKGNYVNNRERREQRHALHSMIGFRLDPWRERGKKRAGEGCAG